MPRIRALIKRLETKFAALHLTMVRDDHAELTITVACEDLVKVMKKLRDDKALHFEQLIDVCGVDYLTYGQVDWATESATSQGFNRARETAKDPQVHRDGPRFVVVYHLLSLTHNIRVRVKVGVLEETMTVPSVTSIWPSANWFEREAYDMYGIHFDGHPDLRRILTDYGFVGHPFRKDFPLSGHVEMRYDAATQRCVYEPVDIQPRVTVPRVIRHDNRYDHAASQEDPRV